MSLNPKIISPLSNYSGSISQYTSNEFIATEFISSSLPVYQSTGWLYNIKTTRDVTTSTVATNILDLYLKLEANKKYIIECYLGISTIRSANGIRIGVSPGTNVETYYSIEVPTSTTAVGYAFNTTNLAGSGPGNSLNNYYLGYIKAIAITRTGDLSWVPNFSSEAAAGGATDVAIGPSVIYYREY